MTYPNRPPSCHKLKPGLKECPACAGNNVEIPRGVTWVICRNSDCNSEGPINDPYGHKWNSIPRRLEVAELLRLVDDAIISPPTPAEVRLLQYSAKLRKEWNI